MPKEIIYTKTTYTTHETLSFKTTPDIIEIAFRWKKICLENLYAWQSMDKDIIEEARKIVNGSP